jgi:hypothetical protein
MKRPKKSKKTKRFNAKHPRIKAGKRKGQFKKKR